MDSEGKVVRLAGGAVVATYREIADHFGLVNPEKGRQKAKRAGWPAEPQNHPADPVRVRVPQDAWEGASLSRERAARARGRGRPLKPEGEPPHDAPEPPSLIKELEGEAATLRSALDRERERADRAEREREEARIRAAAAEGEAKGLRLALEEARRPFWRRWLGVATLCAASALLPPVASAQVDPGSATWVMPGCRASIAESRSRPADYAQGVCMGMVRGIFFMHPDVCAPLEVTNGQILRVVVRYIDMRPERQHESFAKIVAEALGAAWPCRR